MPNNSQNIASYSSEKIKKVFSLEDVKEISRINQKYLERVKILAKEVQKIRVKVLGEKDKRQYQEILKGLKKWAPLK